MYQFDKLWEIFSENYLSTKLTNFRENYATVYPGENID